MTTPQPALDHYRARRRRAEAVAGFASEQWSKVDRNDIARSWLRLIPGLAAVVTAAQLASADEADPYLDQVVPQSTVDALVQAAAFAGAAADGRSLLTLLFNPVVVALRAISKGVDVERAMAGAAANLDMIVRSEVADAGRVADQVATTARPKVEGYTRVVVGRTCNRCIILAGRFYVYSEGFRRHPRCDCIMLPTSQAEAAALVQDPMAIYEEMTEAERTAAGWSEGDQRAIDAGADINQVTNAQRGTYTAGGREFTREGITRRAVFGGYTIDPETGRLRRRVGKAPARLTPDQIFEDATDRDEAIRLLIENGYLLEVPRREQVPAAPKVTAKPRNAFGDNYIETFLTQRDARIGEAQRELEEIERNRQGALRSWETGDYTAEQRRAGFIRANQYYDEQRRETEAEIEALRRSKDPALDEPTGKVTRSGTPSVKRAQESAVAKIDPGISPADRETMSTELRRQAGLSTRTAMMLRGVFMPTPGSAGAAEFTATSERAVAYYWMNGDQQHTMWFSPEWVEHRHRTDGACRASLQAGWWTPSGAENGLATTLAHEYGHHIATSIFRNGNGAPKVKNIKRLLAAISEALGVPLDFKRDPYREIDRLVANQPALVKTLVSEYAAKSANEFLAEVWQEWSTMGEQARPHIRLIGRVLQQLAQEGAFVE